MCYNKMKGQERETQIQLQFQDEFEHPQISLSKYY